MTTWSRSASSALLSSVSRSRSRGDLLEAPAVVGAQLVERVAVLVERRQGVVERRQDALAHRAHRHVDVDGRAAQLLTAEVLGEGELERPLRARLEPDERVGEPGKQALAVDVEVAILLFLAAEHLVAAAHHQGAAQHVTRLRGPLDVAQLAVAPAQLLDHLLDLLVGDLGGGHLDAQAAVVAELRPRGAP